MPRGVRSKNRQAAMEQEMRRMMARELHDRVAQTLTAMLVDVENFKTQQVGWDDVLREMDSIQSATRQVLSSLRQLLHDLRGENPAGDSFVLAVRTLLTRFAEATGIECEFDVQPGWPEDLTPGASLNLFRIVEESLANVRMYSGARNLKVSLEAHREDQLALVIDDDGRGVDTKHSRPGLGTVGMKERALFLGGQLRIVSEVGDGTTVLAVFPKELLVPAAQPEAALELIPQGA
jgi:signal transduction histidine kinase